jgi:hypothetical protein
MTLIASDVAMPHRCRAEAWLDHLTCILELGLAEEQPASK